MAKERYNPEIYDPTKVCGEVLENLRFLAKAEMSLNPGGRLRPDQVQQLKKMVKFDREDHARHRSSLLGMLHPFG